MKRYKLIIFLNCFHLTNDQRALIRRKALNQGRTVLWCYAPGLFNEAKTSVPAMRELTGMNLMRAEKPDRVQARIALTEDGARLGSQIQPVHPTGSAATAAARPTALPGIIGHQDVWAQLFFVDDPQATALGHLEGRKEVALAMKRMKSWTSIYTLNPVLPAAFLRALARHAGVHLYNDRDDTLYASRSFLTLAADAAGHRRLKLPRRCDVFDPFTGEWIGRGVKTFEREFQPKETVIWRLA
jgi:hypothetical protein